MRQYFDDSTTNAKPSDFWKKLKPLLPSKKNPTQNIILVDSTRSVTDQIDVANVFNDYFTDLASQNVPNQNDNFFATHPSVLAIKDKNTEGEFNFIHVSVDSVYKLLATLDPKKSSGPDGLSPRILKAASSAIFKSLTAIINKIIDDSCWPSEWKKSNVVPVFKKDDRTDKGKYCPISLLSIVSKIAEQVINDQLMNG